MAERINRHIFITGATGFIGSHFLKNLLNSIGVSDVIYVLSRQPESFDDPRIKNVIGTLEAIEACDNELLQSNFVYHLAGEGSYNKAIDYDRINYEPTKKMVGILKNSRVLERFVLVSTIGAVDRRPEDRCKEPLNEHSLPAPQSAYGRSKLKAEEFIKQSGIPYTIIRPAWVYGRSMRVRSHLSRFVGLVYKESPLIRFGYPGQVSLIHVEDLARGLTACLSTPSSINKTYFAATESRSIGKLFAIIYEHIKGRKLFQIPLPALSWFWGRFHHKIPLTAANLFLNYLWADGQVFKSELLNNTFFVFEEKTFDIINTHINNSGYWLITGANSGIGYELTCRLHTAGKHLILVDKETDNLVGFGKQRIIKTDLSNSEEIMNMIAKISHYRLYGLINNAGVGYKGDFIGQDQEQVAQMIAVNVIAPVAITKALAPAIIKHDGVIVNIASSAGHHPLPGMAVYAATKSFILNWSSALWYELRGQCFVLTCSPSGTNTQFQKNAGVKRQANLLSPYDVSSRIYKAIEKRRPFLFIGFKNWVTIQLARCFPSVANTAFWGQLFKKLR